MLLSPARGPDGRAVHATESASSSREPAARRDGRRLPVGATQVLIGQLSPYHDAVDLDQGGKVPQIVRHQRADFKSERLVHRDGLGEVRCALIDLLHRQFALKPDELLKHLLAVLQDLSIEALRIEFQEWSPET